MTTPAKPERMTEAELHEIETTPPTTLYAALSEREVLLEELRAGREEEGRLSRLDGAGWTLAEALAHEFGEQLAARLEAEQEFEDLTRDLDAILGLGPTEEIPAAVERVVAERDAAREEAERLRTALEKTAGCVAFARPDPNGYVWGVWFRDPGPERPEVLTPTQLHTLIQETLGHADK